MIIVVSCSISLDIVILAETEVVGVGGGYGPSSPERNINYLCKFRKKKKFLLSAPTEQICPPKLRSLGSAPGYWWRLNH